MQLKKIITLICQNSFALVNIFINYGFKLVQDFISKKQQEVDHTSWSELLPQTMSAEQVIQMSKMWRANGSQQHTYN